MNFMQQKTKTILAVALLAWAAPTGPVLAEEPSNAQLYEMYLKLRDELTAVRAENRALRALIDARDQTTQTATAATAPAAAALPTGATPDAHPAPPPATAGTLPAAKDKAIPVEATVKQGALTFRSEDGNIVYKLDGRLLVDAGFVHNALDNNPKNMLHSNSELRQASLALKTTLYRDWEGTFDVNFANPNATVDGVKLRDMTLAYVGLPRTAFTVGNQKPQFSMEELSSSRWDTFMESGLPVLAFAPGRRLGATATHWEESYSAGASLFGDAWDKDASTDNNAEGVGWSARLVARPYVRDNANQVVHVGVNYLMQEPQSDATNNAVKINTGPEADLIDYKFLNTSDIPYTDSMTTWDFELAGKWNRFYAQSEYMRTDLHRYNGQPEPTFTGWYAMVAAFLTDDTRTYDLANGYFGAVVPNGAWGAWELALRYSMVDLNGVTGYVPKSAKNLFGYPVPIQGGGSTDATVGLNWYVNHNIIFRTNYIHVNHDANAAGSINATTGVSKFAGGDTLNIYGARMEYLF
ncbi:MAG: hypothetical protein HQL87_15465 [Magnetococcales bacterium]|nr:hypothetical protein [Magnetococcales bacterium]